MTPSPSSSEPAISHWNWVRENVDLLVVAQSRLRSMKQQHHRWLALCPFHDDHHPSLTIDPGVAGLAGSGSSYAGHFICSSCRATGTAIDLVAQCDGISAEAAMEQLYAEWGGPGTTPGPAGTGASPPQAKPAPPPAPAPAGRALSPVEQWLAEIWKLLPLTDDHRRYLHERTLSGSAVRYHQFRSLPPADDPWRRDWRVRSRKWGEWPPEGVPGLTTDEGGTLVGPAGILIPVYDWEGVLTGAQIRPDHPGTGGKYRWWSSRDQAGGAPAVSRPTWVLPQPQPGVPPMTWEHASTVIVTEGILKAILIAEWLQVPAVGVAGFAQWQRVFPGLDALPIPEIVVALDADVWDDPQKSPIERACWQGLHQRYPARSVYYLRWDGTQAKGLDDVCIAGIEWQMLAIPDA